MNSASVLSCHQLTKSYQQGPQCLVVLERVELDVKAGEKVAIVGASGSGKSTLLNMLGGLDTPSSGKVVISGQNMADLSAKQRGLLRNSKLGFVYQFHHLLAEFTALENVAMPLMIGGVKKAEAQRVATELLVKVGLSQRLQHKPAELSGGERQRVAIARSLATSPGCVLMDEPTGNLDRENAERIEALLSDLNRDLGISIVLVTHDMTMAKKMDRILKLQNGCLTEVVEGV
ncbi:Lipoprotein-releasing system ATP-binding protein LolD [Sinobacterium norvegicum]|uniref:Lipoprotein-releasing system ATP-binding protein LolD n=1 Tax=Sinobacterium norvegicum TaxID=1641715 RepID=A0ABN8ECA2_9GAMM|nr:lipoprotein-releasing ABC transporter ATP-binding protein LolD [Sinobacterium norvegicum]CAH0989998.1 Lipoprotein-releasing system ATP-binding protein LolD [Sinobacterium norvegicum]